ncbi:MAG: GNAT family N-acetyltransferase [Chloroflexota bacterium]
MRLRPPEEFDTARLRLRMPNLGDAEDIFNLYAQDKQVTRFLTWKPHGSIEETKEFLICCMCAWNEGTAFPWVLIEKETNQLVGMIEVEFEKHRAKLGYVLARPFWGAGYGTEAAHLVIDWAIAQPKIFRVWAVCDVENLPSARVLEKAGMKREGTLKRWLYHPNFDKKPRDCYVYAIVK